MWVPKVAGKVLKKEPEARTEMMDGDSRSAQCGCGMEPECGGSWRGIWTTGRHMFNTGDRQVSFHTAQTDGTQTSGGCRSGLIKVTGRSEGQGNRQHPRARPKRAQRNTVAGPRGTVSSPLGYTSLQRIQGCGGRRGRFRNWDRGGVAGPPDRGCDSGPPAEGD